MKKKVKKSKKKVKRAMPKKKAKRPAKKAKRAAKKVSAKSGGKKMKPIGKVTHFYNHIKVAIVKFNKNVKVGIELHFRGATTDFKEKTASMQLDHEKVTIAKKGKLIGIKVKKRVRDGDAVYEAK